MAAPYDKLTLTVTECARLLGISRGSAYEGIRRGEIPYISVGRRILVPRAALEGMLAEAGDGKAKEMENGST
ncbi:MAG: helix-turn-helix domain-containing protein [Dehalococcoidia bacterium]|nr:helix-turn-helix domain-containing protein [Dehalococcoidia bacterium]